MSMNDADYRRLIEGGFTREQANAIIEVIFNITTPEDY